MLRANRLLTVADFALAMPEPAAKKARTDLAALHDFEYKKPKVAGRLSFGASLGLDSCDVEDAVT